ncbi:MAG: DUF6119 family protein [Vicinamibacterales bacterium]
MARRADTPLVSLTLNLLREEITDPKKALAHSKSPKLAIATPGVFPGATLYYEAPRSKPVSWLEFIDPAFPGLDNLRSQHASAVLFFPVGSRIFACTFGYGHALLSATAVESSFGIKTALKLCDPATLKSIDYRTIEERTRIGRVQLSQGGSVGAFRVDTDTDLLRGIEAKSKNLSVCERIGGRWASATVGARVDVAGLPQLGAALLKVFKKARMPPEFAWIENVQRVTDPSLVDALDGALEAKLDASEFVNIRFAIPELAGPSIGIDARLFAVDGPECDSDISTYLDARPRAVARTLQAAKKTHKVCLVDTASGKARATVPIYQCIVAEIEHASEQYLLADGEWFCLDKDFVAEVNKSMTKIPRLSIPLPNWKKGQREDEWNIAAVAALKSRKAVLLDKHMLSMAGRYSAVEPADILVDDRTLLHVKRRDKSSGGLSHLFAQGSVATEMLTSELSFRKKLAGLLGTNQRNLARELGAGSLDTSKWTVAYVLLGANEKDPAGSLPFFSKVNLRKHVQRLQSMQYTVNIAGVPHA